MDEGEPKVEAIVAAIEENVNGLWGAAQVGTATMWCQGKQVLVREADGSTDGWRAMTPEDVDALHHAFGIDRATWARQHTRVLR
jgi:ABC-type microcin C transport system permease subunit YejB